MNGMANKKEGVIQQMFKSKKSLIALLVLAMFLIANVAVVSAAGQVITPGKWAPNTYKSMQKLIDENGVKSPNYNSAKKPYVVFDWDNTAIMNDTEEALYQYQIENIAFKLTPQEMGDLVKKNVPKDPFLKDYNNAAGQSVNVDAIAADIVSSYTYLYDNYIGLKGLMSLEDLKKTDEYLDFRAKMYYAYEAIGDTFGTKVSYTWVLFFFKNMTTDEVSALSEKSNDRALGEKIGKTKWVSPASLPGKAGVVGVSHWTGLRLTEEITDLMHTFRNNGIDVYVCTASMEDVVAVFATNPKYGYNLPRANIIGMRLTKVNDVNQDTYLNGYPQTAEGGKTVVLKSLLVDKKGYEPIFIAGDSNGDWNMMVDFKGIKRILVVNRLRSGNKIGALSREAAETIGKPNARVLLQGRNENTGLWMPTEYMLKYGSTTEALVAK